MSEERGPAASGVGAAFYPMIGEGGGLSIGAVEPLLLEVFVHGPNGALVVGVARKARVTIGFPNGDMSSISLSPGDTLIIKTASGDQVMIEIQGIMLGHDLME